MDKAELILTIHDPNPPDAAAKLLRALLLEAHRPRAAAALQGAPRP